jgi:hypothetical protein
MRAVHVILVGMPHVQSPVVNPLVRLAFRLGIPDPGDALLETIAPRTGKPRLTPVCEGLEGETFWLISERGRDAEWVGDIETSPRVRVKQRSRRPAVWRSGVAQILDGDDPRQDGETWAGRILASALPAHVSTPTPACATPASRSSRPPAKSSGAAAEGHAACPAPSNATRSRRRPR